MDWNTYFAFMANRHGKSIPPLVRQLATDGMFDWGEFGPQWYTTIFPQLLPYPPFLFLGLDCEIPSPDTLVNDWADCDFGLFELTPEYENSFIPFAITGAGDLYTLAYLDHTAEPAIALLRHDDGVGMIYSRSFADFIFIMLLQVNSTWLNPDWSVKECHTHLRAQLESHRKYLKPEHYLALNEVYSRDFITLPSGGRSYVTEEEFHNLLHIHASETDFGMEFAPFVPY